MTQPVRTRGATKSPKQRATEARALAQRVRDRAAKALDAAKQAHEDAEGALIVAEARLAHRKADPDLKDDPTLPLGGAE